MSEQTPDPEVQDPNEPTEAGVVPADVDTHQHPEEFADQALGDALQASMPEPGDEPEDDAEPVVSRPPVEDGLYDPFDHSAEEVREHLAGASVEEFLRVRSLEEQGKARSTVLDARQDPEKVEESPDGYTRVLDE